MECSWGESFANYAQWKLTDDGMQATGLGLIRIQSFTEA